MPCFRALLPPALFSVYNTTSHERSALADDRCDRSSWYQDLSFIQCFSLSLFRFSLVNFAVGSVKRLTGADPELRSTTTTGIGPGVPRSHCMTSGPLTTSGASLVSLSRFSCSFFVLFSIVVRQTSTVLFLNSTRSEHLPKSLCGGVKRSNRNISHQQTRPCLSLPSCVLLSLLRPPLRLVCLPLPLCPSSTPDEVPSTKRYPPTQKGGEPHPGPATFAPLLQCSFPCQVKRRLLQRYFLMSSCPSATGRTAVARPIPTGRHPVFFVALVPDTSNAYARHHSTVVGR